MTAKDVYKMRKEVEQELKDSAIPFTKNYIFSFNPRLKRALGRAKRKGNLMYVELSTLLYKDPIKMRDILVHELLHTVPGCMNHGKLWKQYAEVINFNSGYNVKRCYDTESLNSELQNELVRVKNYKVVCQKCDKIYTYQKQSKVVKYPSLYRCKCGGTLKSFNL
jgi:predicted SprT family Zn-dependent metalloprotease